MESEREEKEEEDGKGVVCGGRMGNKGEEVEGGGRREKEGEGWKKSVFCAEFRSEKKRKVKMELV